MKKFTVKLLTLTICLLSACGGGGGGGDEGNAKFAGTWSGALFLLSNDCPFAAEDTLLLVHVVNQDGERIVVNTSSGAVFSGTTDGDDGFTVGNEVVPVSEVTPGIFCTVNSGIAYSAVDGDEADVVAANQATCSNGPSSFSCVTAYIGAAER